MKTDERKQLFEAFGRVGREAEAADVEFALDAQMEAVEDDADRATPGLRMVLDL